jgi:hypothetical protein
LGKQTTKQKQKAPTKLSKIDLVVPRIKSPLAPNLPRSGSVYICDFCIIQCVPVYTINSRTALPTVFVQLFSFEFGRRGK